MSINWTNISKCVNFSMVGENKLKKRCAGVCVCVCVCFGGGRGRGEGDEDIHRVSISDETAGTSVSS